VVRLHAQQRPAKPVRALPGERSRRGARGAARPEHALGGRHGGARRCVLQRRRLAARLGERVGRIGATRPPGLDVPGRRDGRRPLPARVPERGQRPEAADLPPGSERPEGCPRTVPGRVRRRPPGGRQRRRHLLRPHRPRPAYPTTSFRCDPAPGATSVFRQPKVAFDPRRPRRRRPSIPRRTGRGSRGSSRRRRGWRATGTTRPTSPVTAGSTSRARRRSRPRRSHGSSWAGFMRSSTCAAAASTARSGTTRAG